MIVEIATAATAVATACAVFLTIRQQREDAIRNGPPIRISNVFNDGDLVFFTLTVFPANHHVVIRRISVPGTSIATAIYERTEWGKRTDYKVAHELSDSIDVEVDLLPSSLSPTPVELTLALRLNKAQNSVRICFHRDRAWFSAKHKITAIISNEAD